MQHPFGISTLAGRVDHHGRLVREDLGFSGAEQLVRTDASRLEPLSTPGPGGRLVSVDDDPPQEGRIDDLQLRCRVPQGGKRFFEVADEILSQEPRLADDGMKVAMAHNLAQLWRLEKGTERYRHRANTGDGRPPQQPPRVVRVDD